MSRDFPTRTAGDCVLPNGETVWVQTLNELGRTKADQDAHRYAVLQTMHLRKGGTDYKILQAQARGLSEEEQATFIADQNASELAQQCTAQFPDPEQPEKGEMEPAEFIEATAKWEEACKLATEKRENLYADKYQSEVKKALAMSRAARVSFVVNGYIAQQYWTEFVTQQTLEILYRAVRLAEDHDMKYFRSVTAVEDADDEVRQTLVEFYTVGLNPPKSEDIPTSPVVS
jgi:hypothetical protein